MSSIINTNSLSLLTQNNLTKSQSSLTTAIQRLSSGLRINSAKDDAAGQAIANRFTSNIKGLSQAQRNANDGISLAQTTEGALNEINNNLQRVRELTVQAKNGSNSQTDLDSIQSEITQRMLEIDRTSAQTDFNGTKVLASTQNLAIQVGANDNEKINIGLQAINTTTLNIASFNINGIGTANTAATASDLTGKVAYTEGGTVPGNAGYTTHSAWAQGATVAGTTAYTQTTVVKDASDTAFSSTGRTGATRADVFAAVSGGQTTVQLDGNTTGIDSYTVAGSGATAVFNSATVGSTTFTSAIATALIPTSGQTSATVTIGGQPQAIKIDSLGAITAADGTTPMYMDGSGNLSQTNAAGSTLANIGQGGAGDLLISMNNATSGSTAALQAWTGGTIAMTTAGGSTITFDAGAAGSMAETGLGNNDAIANGGDKFSIANALSQTDMQAKSVAATGTVVNLDGGASTADNYSIDASGAVTDGAATPAPIFIDPAGTSAAGKLSTTATTDVLASTGATTTTTETYYVHSNGAVMDNAGNNVYNDSDVTNLKGFTLDARSGDSSTFEAMKVIDAALAQVDALRGSLGAVQNRFDSVISNLGSTITNLSASRSRIEDADYATEVSNMTRAQILQQAGTSVLSKANQSTQGVMSLLQ